LIIAFLSFALMGAVILLLWRVDPLLGRALFELLLTLAKELLGLCASECVLALSVSCTGCIGSGFEPSYLLSWRADGAPRMLVKPAQMQRYVRSERWLIPNVFRALRYSVHQLDYAQNRSWMNRIDRKHVDFLICDPGSMAPALAVELDDGSHATAPSRVNQGNRIWSEFRSFGRAFVPRVARTWTRTIRKKALT
jgi:hypothetical protein